MDLENFGGASTLLCIDFLKLWGGQCPPGPPVPAALIGIPIFRNLASSLRGVEPPYTRELELQTSWNKGGILWLVLS